MDYFDDRQHVTDYIRMAAGYDGRELIALLEAHLPAGSSVLELGMGPGTDLDLLAQRYTVTGSDLSQQFLDIYRETHPTADLLRLDAVTLATERIFDCIYSNKVLQHLSTPDLARSFLRQRALLNESGLLLHAFWHGAGEEFHHGLRTVYYTEATLLPLIGPGFTLLASGRYAEMEAGDSFYVLLRCA